MSRVWAARAPAAPKPPSARRKAADRVSNRIPEWKLQEGVVSALDALLRERPGAFAYAAGLEGVRLRPSQRQAMRAQGMQAGEPDLRFYFPAGRVALIELKAKDGRLSTEQKERHALLTALGFTVYTIKRESVADMVAAVLDIVREELAR